MKKQISTREDIYTLVTSFYTSVRKDKTLGPIFNKIIDDWPSHMDHLTDFWETNLFAIKKYKGNPIAVHQEVDQKVNYTINVNHFGIWLNLWANTIDDLFEGEIATLAKYRARKMSTFLLVQMHHNKPDSTLSK